SQGGAGGTATSSVYVVGIPGGGTGGNTPNITIDVAGATVGDVTAANGGNTQGSQTQTANSSATGGAGGFGGAGGNATGGNATGGSIGDTTLSSNSGGNRFAANPTFNANPTLTGG